MQLSTLFSVPVALGSTLSTTDTPLTGTDCIWVFQET